MGNWVSKQMGDTRAVLSETPDVHKHRTLDDDPRSPSTNVDRTPIEVENTPRKRLSSQQSTPSTDASSDSPNAQLIPNKRKCKSVPENLHKRIFDRHPLAPKNIQNNVNKAVEEQQYKKL